MTVSSAGEAGVGAPTDTTINGSLPQMAKLDSGDNIWVPIGTDGVLVYLAAY
jgi:hypothetical protein